jgi:hypothetical protein
MSSLDSPSSEEVKKDQMTVPRKIHNWMRTPNKTPNGLVLLGTTILGVASFGSVYGLRNYVTDSNYKICITRVDGRIANRANFQDFYVTLESQVSEDARPLVAGLLERMDERTPELSYEDC